MKKPNIISDMLVFGIAAFLAGAMLFIFVLEDQPVARAAILGMAVLGGVIGGTILYRKRQDEREGE